MDAQPWPTGDASVLAPVQEHDDLRKVMRDLLAAHADHEQVRRAADSPLGWSAELWRLLNEEMSVCALLAPEDQGGLGFGMAELAVVLEEAGRALLPEPLLVSAVLGSRAVVAPARGAVPEELVRQVLAGELVVTVAPGILREGGSETVAAQPVETVAAQPPQRPPTQPPSATCVLTGTVGPVLLGAAADLLVVAVDGPDGKSIVLADLRDAATVTRRSLEVLDLTRRQATLELDGAPAYRLAGPDDAQTLRTELRVFTRVALAAEHVGMIEAMLDLTSTYTRQREQFGRPLASFQAVKHRLADVLVDLERARSAARYAAAILDDEMSAAELPAAIAAAVATDAVIRVAHETIQLHGGIGFTWEHAAHYYLRRALGDEAVFGSARAHRAHVAALLGIR